MRAVIQRVKEASVKVSNDLIGQINQGFLIYLGIHENDTKEITLKMAEKVSKLRIFEDDFGKMNLGLSEVAGACLVISQFTLYGDTKKNNRPSFITAARPDHAIPLYELFIDKLKEKHLVQTGSFGADMQVSSINDGPVTIIIEM